MFYLRSFEYIGAGIFLGLVMLPVSTKLECHFLIVFFVENFFFNFVENFLYAIVTDRVWS